MDSLCKQISGVALFDFNCQNSWRTSYVENKRFLASGKFLNFEKKYNILITHKRLSLLLDFLKINDVEEEMQMTIQNSLESFRVGDVERFVKLSLKVDEECFRSLEVMDLD